MISHRPTIYFKLRTLCAFPTESTTFLKAELSARGPIRRNAFGSRSWTWMRRISDFECREAASRKLARLGEQAEAALKKAVAQANEVRARASALLQSLANRKFK